VYALILLGVMGHGGWGSNTVGYYPTQKDCEQYRAVVAHETPDGWGNTKLICLPVYQQKT
jgi:hypothetical protein